MPTIIPTVAGIDIGTTTISLVVLNARTLAPCRVQTIPGGDPVASSTHRIQSTKSILDKCTALLTAVREDFPGLTAIGLTGQMHGIVYTDAAGRPCSDLYTWQDPSGAAILDRLQPHCPTPLASGYGAVTHGALCDEGKVPAEAAQLCTIMDCLGMHLTGRKTPLIHTSNAASFGFFDLKTGDFDRAALDAAGLDAGYFPACTADAETLGEWQGVPVYVAIGDNQASFRGSVEEPERSILVNIGTGSQVSVLRPMADAERYSCDLRPYDAGHVLANYSALCGGYAWALFERFVRQILVSVGMEDEPCYELLCVFAAQALDDPEPWGCETTFNGTRAEPGKAASFSGIRAETFTPGHMARAVLDGIVDELYEGLREVLADCGEMTLVGSGNAVRKNPVLREIIERKFGGELTMPEYAEEAATGAALWAMEGME